MNLKCYLCLDCATNSKLPIPTSEFSGLPEFQRAWEQELLTRLVTLNAQRAAEEANGQIRYLRPEYQRKKEEDGRMSQSALELPAAKAKKNSKVPIPNSKLAKRAWPKSLADRVRLIDETLRTTPGPHSAPSLAKQFTRASEKDVAEILETLAALGRTVASPEI